MARVNFSTTSWGAFIGTPNRLGSELRAGYIDIINVLGQSPVSETYTPNEATATYANGGTARVTGTGLDSAFPTVDFIGYSDPQGNSASMLGRLTANVNTGAISGSLSSFDVRFSGIELSVDGNLAFSLSGSGTGSSSIIGATLKVSGWTFTLGGSLSYTNYVPSGSITSLVAISPQGDAFSISDATIPAPLLNSIGSIDFFLSQSYLQGNDVLTAESRNDVFAGFAGSDTMSGGGGNDVLTGGSGNDSIDGGTGIDEAVYSGNRASYTVAETATGLTVADNTGAEGTDTLTNIERVRYSDGSVAFDTSAVSGEAFRIYQAAFNRTPDQVGLGYWIKQMDDGMSVADVAARFIDSNEFRSLYGANPSTGQLVDAIYNNVLHRVPDTAGRNFYVNQIDTHQKSLSQVLADFSESPENQLQVLGVIQSGIEYMPWTG